MKHQDIRDNFIDYFVKNGHTIVKPGNIVPTNDPTLLFTNAGMNQFKDALLGREKRSYTRCANIQPCIRVGGKHNDLDAVGKDGRHNTWFEMMGNWSFGDYYKESAIHFAWELVTKGYGVDSSRLYASVYKDDEESAALWKKIAGLPDSRIIRLGNIDKGDEENFWSMGPTGPCGPCTELYYDQGEALGQDVVGGDTDRYLEFWNLVFMEFNRSEDGTLTPLPMRSVDTGMGLERMTAILQGKTNIFHTDLFRPVIDRICEMTSRDFAGPDAPAMCVVADHIRGLTFVLADGGEFDRAGRGYVLRRILRRAVLHGDFLGMKEPWIHALIPTVIAATSHYDISEEIQVSVAAAIKSEEEKFFRTLDRGLMYFNRVIDGLKAKEDTVICGADSFQLYDTFGFPVDLTRILAEKQGLSIDIQGFEAKLEEQRSRSKEAQEFYDAGGWIVIDQQHDTGFAGYDLTSLDVRVNRYRDSGDGKVDVVLNHTPFYVEGGGELSDRGRLVGDSVEMEVVGVAKSEVGVVHSTRLLRGKASNLSSERELNAVIDIAYRQAKAAHHTATHLLHSALRHILGPSARQMGSQVTSDSLRFDFSAERTLSADELATVERMVNGWILEDHSVNKIPDVPLKEALQRGALAFFSENYGEKVRMLEVPGISSELCGGNHVNHTALIGSFQIVGEQSVGAGVRRIEAIAHLASVRRSHQMRTVVNDISLTLSTPVDQMHSRIEHLLGDIKRLTKERERLIRNSLSGKDTGVTLENELLEIHGVPTLIKVVSIGDLTVMKEMIDNLRAKVPTGVFALVGESDGRGIVVLGIGAEAVKSSNLKAGDLAREIGKLFGSGGGGRADFAQAGFKNMSIEDAAKIVDDVFRAKLEK